MVSIPNIPLVLAHIPLGHATKPKTRLLPLQTLQLASNSSSSCCSLSCSSGFPVSISAMPKDGEGLQPPVPMRRSYMRIGRLRGPLGTRTRKHVFELAIWIQIEESIKTSVKKQNRSWPRFKSCSRQHLGWLFVFLSG